MYLFYQKYRNKDKNDVSDAQLSKYEKRRQMSTLFCLHTKRRRLSRHCLQINHTCKLSMKTTNVLLVGSTN